MLHAAWRLIIDTSSTNISSANSLKRWRIRHLKRNCEMFFCLLSESADIDTVKVACEVHIAAYCIGCVELSVVHGACYITY